MREKTDIHHALIFQKCEAAEFKKKFEEAEKKLAEMSALYKSYFDIDHEW